ncbi:DNA-binding protein HU-beta [Oxalobacteraceae bacterium GrIS 2.11]
MNRRELIDLISSDTQISKTTTDRVLDSFIRRVKERIANGEKVKIAGFGTFELTRAVARIGRNPKTGEAVQIASSLRPRFRPSVLFKGRVKKNT